MTPRKGEYDGTKQVEAAKDLRIDIVEKFTQQPRNSIEWSDGQEMNEMIFKAMNVVFYTEQDEVKGNEMAETKMLGGTREWQRDVSAFP